ncbi:hypothetical protein ACP70R_009330 [Stipagrostis hirtigluma subsp. patula]
MRHERSGVVSRRRLLGGRRPPAGLMAAPARRRPPRRLLCSVDHSADGFLARKADWPSGLPGAKRGERFPNLILELFHTPVCSSITPSFPVFPSTE